MSVLLIANIGNSDVEVADETLLPPSLQSKHRPPARLLGEELNRDLPKYAPHVRLPLLGPTLRWLVEQEGVAVDNLQVVLFATNQPSQLTREEERRKDTLPIAEVVKSLLVDIESLCRIAELPQLKTAFHSEQICIGEIVGSPADYSNMLAWYSEELPQYQERQREAQVYLEVSGGTPAMTAMLILAGVEVFGSQAHTLYINRGDTQPYEVSVAGELYARRLRRMLRTQVDLHAYTVALHTLHAYTSLIASDEKGRSVIEALLHYADRRLAFDFDEARKSLSRARQLTTGAAQVQVQYWLRELQSTSVSLPLAELIHSMRIKYEYGDYADLLQRVFRFQEAALRFMAETLGMQTIEEGKKVDQEWLNSQPGLPDYTRKVKLDIPLNRISLGKIANYLVERDKPAWAPILRKLHTLTDVADLRNKGLSGHGFEGISLAKVEEQYGAPLEALLDDLAAIYRDLFEVELGESPFQAVNALIHTLYDSGQPLRA